tara:strand:- start:56 stop:700 length:645 start_codon:yes stop_codon:yes gene_type:complete
MKVKSFKGGYDDNFSYLIWDDSTLEGAVIDPSVSPELILNFITYNNIKLSKILITHTHYDHISCLDNFLQKYPNVDVHAYEHTRHQFDNNFSGLEHQDKIFLGDIILTVLYTPGHYDDCVCYWVSQEKVIFTGDTVFVGRPGRTINRFSNITHLFHSIYDIILQLPMETIIYPGHDYGDSETISISNNINHSKFFSSTSEQEFIAVMKDYELNR